MFAFADPTELWLDPTVWLTETQPDLDSYRPLSRWNARLNQTCLAAVLNWIRAEHTADAAAWVEASQYPMFWEVVNGSAIQLRTPLGERRLVIIPSEAIDDAELLVPQEWVDIPSWVADCYLAVQVQLEAEPWLRVWGYATHQELKSGRYDAADRTYSLDADQLTRDWSALWVTLQFCSDMRATVAPLPEVPSPQAENLIQRLATANFPRLAIPFELWGGLIQQEQWRQRLYQQRTGQRVAVANLSQWLQQQVTSGWQLLENLLGEPSFDQMAFNLRSAEQAADRSQAKPIQLGEATMVLVMQVSQSQERLAIGVQVHPLGQSLLPAGLRLSLEADGETLQTVESGEVDNFIQLRRFRCPAGTPFQVKLALAEVEVTEEFVA